MTSKEVLAENKEPQIYSNKTSRREFLLKSMMAAGHGIVLGSAIGIVIDRLLEETRSPHIPTEDYGLLEETPNPEEKAIEDLYGINILRTDEPEVPLPHLTKEQHRLNQLFIIEKTLSALPSHFYRPDEVQDRYFIAIEEGERKYYDGLCLCRVEDANFGHGIILNHFLGSEDLKRDFQIITHEFTHLLNHVKREENYPDHTLDSLSTRLKDISGGDLYRLFNSILSNAQEELDVLHIEENSLRQKGIQPSSENLGEEFFDRQSFFSKMTGEGLKRNFNSEFFATVSEEYVLGKDRFLAYFSKLLGSQVLSTDLYSLVKEDIFLGQEYQDFPLRGLV